MYIYVFFLAAAHPDETQLHSSQLTYDLYNPSVGIYHPGAGNIHNLTWLFYFSQHTTFTFFLMFLVRCRKHPWAWARDSICRAI